MKIENHRTLLALALTLTLVASQNSFAQEKASQRSKPLGYTFQLLSLPGFPSSNGTAINNEGTTLLRGVGGPVDATYLRDSDGRLVHIAHPGALVTVGLGLNNRGDVVGDVALPNTTYYSGFVRVRSGTFTTFAYPGLGGPATGMQTNAINNRREVVGGYAISAEDRGAFLRARNGTIGTFQYGGGALAYGINDRGQISGQSPAGSFLREPDGSFTPIEFAGASDTQAFGINNRGQVVGLYYTDVTRGFVRYEDGTFQTVHVPGADNTVLIGINDRGTVIGTAYYAERQVAFIGTPRWK